MGSPSLHPGDLASKSCDGDDRNSHHDGGTEDNPAFRGLLEAISPLAASPTGVGLDVPAWLRRLEDELRKVRADVPDPDEDDDREPDPLPPHTPLDFDALKRQLVDWDKPLGEPT